MMKYSLILASAAILAGCATTSQQAPAPLGTRTPSVQSNATPFGALPPRTLAAGQCAMFLWVRSAEPRLVFFGSAQGEGHAVINGRETGLHRTGVEGREALGQYEDQTYTHDGNKVEVRVSFQSRSGLDHGVVVPQGTLRLRQSDGWETVLPVGGLVACQR
jgi:hypothetical protein